MDISALEDLGLSKGESKVYLRLLELGTTKVGTVIEKTGMASSAVHNSLNILLEKGCISYIKKGKIKYYQATNPKYFLNVIEEKKKNFQKILPELIQKQKPREKNEAEIYIGFKGVTNMLSEMVEDGKKNDEYVFFSADIEFMNKEIQDFFRKFDPKRKEKGLTTRALAPLKLKKYYESRAKKGFFEVRYTTQPLPPNMAIFKDKISLLTWGEKPVAFLIHSTQLAEIYKRFFNLLWDKYK